ncbi:MAG: hypothetical protein RL518_1688 [Pseudomonadota bacterium]|jgi:cystathionine beta-lyase/cystathionine gamma-synthase
MYQPGKGVREFDERLGDAIHKGIQVGDFLSGSFPKGASVRLPPHGDGGAHYDYARQGHPGGAHVESILANLEMGNHALCFSDGMRAISAATEVVVRPGDTIVAHSSMYGGSIRYLNSLAEWDINVQWMNLADSASALYILDYQPKVVLLESVSNPLLQVLDMGALMRVAARAGSHMIIDNTLATSYGCVPLDIARQNGFKKLMVVLSITKGYTAGMLGGAVVTDSQELGEKLFRYRQSRGGNASPNDAAEYSKQIESMHVRMERLSENTQALVQFLKSETQNDGIEVLYPENIGVDTPGNTSAYLMRPPGVFTLQCRLPVGSYAALVRHFDDKLIRSNSFNGSVAQFSESTKQSHGSVKDGAQKLSAGITEQLLRISPSSTYGPKTIVGKFEEIIESWQKDVSTAS